jgi:thioredoxin-like negative regulator of GroEL
MPVLVLVYADWCGHCQRYKPLWKKLSQDPNRSVNMAAVRDDMVNKTSLSQRATPVSSYPTVMLIGKNGKAVNFKSQQGMESQSIPNHGDMETMTAIVRNAGTEAGEQALNESAEVTQPVITAPAPPTGPSVSPPNISADVVRTKEQQTGGSLFEVL